LLAREIAFSCRLQKLFQLIYNIFGIMVVVYVKIHRSPTYVHCFAADVAELPALKTVHIGKGLAAGAAYHEIHDYANVRVERYISSCL
jgi:hypothetical protein